MCIRDRCKEYTHRYGKVHSCESTILHAEKIFPFQYIRHVREHSDMFVFAGPDEFKYDTSIDIFTAYKRYIASKPWVATNYLRDPSRKPEWV